MTRIRRGDGPWVDLGDEDETLPPFLARAPRPNPSEPFALPPGKFNRMPLLESPPWSSSDILTLIVATVFATVVGVLALQRVMP